jgi:hypothetical protein
MLGIEPAAPSPTAAEESAFAELAHSVLSPALFRMLIAAYAKETAKSRAAPVVNARVNVSFVDDLVACWARCAIAVVKAGKRVRRAHLSAATLTPISSAGLAAIHHLGRRSVEAHLGSAWSSRGGAALPRARSRGGRKGLPGASYTLSLMTGFLRCAQGNKDEYLSVWCQSIVAKRPSLQHRLTSAILNHDDSPTLLGDDGIHEIPFTRDADSGRFGVTAKELEAKRLALLEGAP